MNFTFHVTNHIESKDLPDIFLTYDAAQAVADTLGCASVDRRWNGRAVHSIAYKPGKAPAVGVFLDVLGAKWEVLSHVEGHRLNDDDRNLKVTWATLARLPL